VHNATKPFKVTVKGESIEDIGTHFNINAYDDEPAIKTTLLEGSVKVEKGNSVVLLKPGQAAVLSINANKIKVEQANIEKTMAWKNGELVFDGDNIVSIMREISRWYNADIVYQTSTEHKIFVGSVSRFENVSEVLKTLELTGTVHFKIEGRRIIVMD
jgi:transmembrane sensor